MANNDIDHSPFDNCSRLYAKHCCLGTHANEAQPIVA